MKNKVDEITKYLWKIPKMDFATVQEIIKLMNSDMLVDDMLRTLKENESILGKTTAEEAIKIALQVFEANKKWK